jgi:catechol 2,3-dioxygenase-like lactoylglutathione lyase family enzyme
MAYRLATSCAALLILMAVAPLRAQLLPPSDAGITMGHIHLLVRDVDSQQKFWTEVVGAKPYQLGEIKGVTMPGVIVMFQKGEPTGGSVGSAMNHIGFLVPNLNASVEKAKAFGSKIESVSPKSDTRPMAQAMIFAPEDIKVELSEDPKLTVPVAHHHLHWVVPSDTTARDWYAKTFSAKPGRRGRFEAADLPGANLSFTPSSDPTTPTKGRAIDHVGFEVKNLEAFCKRLEAEGVKFEIPYRKLPKLGIAVAFFTDAWGTRVELTEGLR